MPVFGFYFSVIPEGYGEDIYYLFFLWRKIGGYVFSSSQQNPLSLKHIVSLALGIFDHLLTVPAPHREPGEDHKSHFICFNLAKFLEFTFQLDKHYNKLKGKKDQPLKSWCQNNTLSRSWLICPTSWFSAQWKLVSNWYSLDILSLQMSGMAPSTDPAILLKPGFASGGNSHYDMCSRAKLLLRYQRSGGGCRSVSHCCKWICECNKGHGDSGALLAYSTGKLQVLC